MDGEEILNKLPAVCKIETMLASGLVEMDPITLRRWCKTGKYPHGTRQGRYWYINPRQFMAWFHGEKEKARAPRR